MKKQVLIYILCCLIILLIGSIARECSNLPVKGIDEPKDSLIVVNDSLKIQVIKLDSIKNEEVKKVLNISNDSSIKLFKELVSK